MSAPGTADLVEAACEVMHDAYERAAVGAGWETQAASRKPWAGVPEANKATMRAAVGALLGWLPTAPAPVQVEITDEAVAQLVGEAWDDGNAMGLDGWIGPNRGSGDVDPEAERGRERMVDRAWSLLNGAGS